MKYKYKSATMTNKMKQAPKTVSKAKSGQVVDGRWRCEQVPGASCPFVRARRCLPARHHCPHYLFTGCHLVDQRPHLGRRAFGAVGDISGRIDCRGGRHQGAPAHQPPAHPQLPPHPTTRMPKFHIVKGPLGKQLSSQTKVT